MKNTGKQLTAARWSVSNAASEFGIDDSTLSKRIKNKGILKADDGMYSTRQICDAIYGDIDGERLRKVTLEADLLAIEKAKEERALVPTHQAIRVWTNVILTLRTKILNDSRLSDDTKSDILIDLKEIPLDDYFEEAPLVENTDDL